VPAAQAATPNTPRYRAQRQPAPTGALGSLGTHRYEPHARVVRSVPIASQLATHPLNRSLHRASASIQRSTTEALRRTPVEAFAFLIEGTVPDGRDAVA